MAKHEQHFVKIPKDLSLIRQKFMFGLTKRQVICFGIGAAIGFPAFYIFNSLLGLQAGALLSVSVQDPLFFADYTRKTVCTLKWWLN